MADSAIRRVLHKYELTIPNDRPFKATLPFLNEHNRITVQYEFRRDYLLHVWKKSVCPTITKLVKDRRKKWGNKHVNKMVYETGMDKVCRDFSMRTETVKVRFIRPNQLEVVQLTPVSDEIRIGASCEAELITQVETDEPEAVAVPMASPRTRATPTAPTEDVWGLPPQPTASVARLISEPVPMIPASMVNDSMRALSPQLHSSMRVVPVDEITASTRRETSSKSSTSSVRGRMTELMSIRCFLTEEEFNTKRKAILESI